MPYHLVASVSPTEHAKRLAKVKRIPELWDYTCVVYQWDGHGKNPIYHIKTPEWMLKPPMYLDVPEHVLCGIGGKDRDCVGYEESKPLLEYDEPPDGTQICRNCLRWLLDNEDYWKD